VVAAGSLVPEGMEVPPSTLVMGVPAKTRRAVSAEELERFQEGVRHYVEKARIYREEQK
jgi:carbonic anhydrase/acetyltransferase-like protein (isoleucine patch superfamily)